MSLKVLFLSAEAAPYSRVGGLGEVAGTLPIALRRQPEAPDVRLVIPYHGGTDFGATPPRLVAEFVLEGQSKKRRAQVYQAELQGVPAFLVAGEEIVANGPVYDSDPARDGAKYCFFSLAALAFCIFMDWTPDIVHANDWHAAIAVHALRHKYPRNSKMAKIKTILTVHNLPYLGQGAGFAFPEYGIVPSSDTRLPPWARDVPLPMGLACADVVTTVSPQYAKEIRTPGFGAGLEDFLGREEVNLIGILNGINSSDWDPAEDRALYQRFGLKSLGKRTNNKAALQAELELPVIADIPLISMVGRIDAQKGVDIAIAALSELEELPWQMVVLGTGNPLLEAAVREFATRQPDRVRASLTYDPLRARRIFAGADMLLIPSRYEPCGLTQMASMRYGCVPIATSVGGLKDTITERAGEEPVTGFLAEEATVNSFVSTISRALSTYAKPKAWASIQKTGMQQDYSWEKSARKYMDVYIGALENAKS